MYRIYVQYKAQADAERIYDYIRYTLLNPQAAEMFLNCLEKRYEQISNNPHGFSIELVNGRQYRKALIKRYVVIFRVDEYAHTVHIIAIGHSLQRRTNVIKHR